MLATSNQTAATSPSVGGRRKGGSRTGSARAATSTACSRWESFQRSALRPMAALRLTSLLA
eukprot:11220360-Alexandrium_andersonii.AAC.1